MTALGELHEDYMKAQAELARLRAVNAELVKALESVVAGLAIPTGYWQSSMARHLEDTARAALARAKVTS